MRKPIKKKPTKIKKVPKKVRAKVSHKSLKKNKIRRFFKSISSALLSQNQSPISRESHSGRFKLPSAYHENKLTLLVRDPWWVFAFWEVTPEREKEVLREILQKGLQKEKTVLRVYDVTGTSMAHANTFLDIELNFFTDNWYIDAGKPDTDWVAELGIRATNGSFFALVRSNTVKTPRFGLSEMLDEEWMMPDDLYWKLFGRMAGLSDRKSSLNIMSSASLTRKPS